MQADRDPRTDPRPLDSVGGRSVAYVATSGLVIYDVETGKGNKKKTTERHTTLESWRRWAKGREATAWTEQPPAALAVHELPIDARLSAVINGMANQYLRDFKVKGQSTPHEAFVRALLDVALLHFYGGFDGTQSFRDKVIAVMQREVPSKP